jgi:hypothetical protein
MSDLQWNGEYEEVKPVETGKPDVGVGKPETKKSEK